VDKWKTHYQSSFGHFLLAKVQGLGLGFAGQGFITVQRALCTVQVAISSSSFSLLAK